MKITEKKIRAVLDGVNDPELNISITDLGLVYDIKLMDKNKVHITMTLTTIGCSLFSQIEVDIKNKLQEIGLKDEDITIELTFDPPWSMEKMSEKAKITLGIM